MSFQVEDTGRPGFGMSLRYMPMTMASMPAWLAVHAEVGTRCQFQVWHLQRRIEDAGKVTVCVAAVVAVVAASRRQHRHHRLTCHHRRPLTARRRQPQRTSTHLQLKPQPLMQAWQVSTALTPRQL